MSRTHYLKKKSLAETLALFVDGLPLLPVRGYARPHAMTVDLGPSTPAQGAVLLLTGWTDYAFSSDNIAAAQAGYARPNLMQRYLYVRASQKDPFDILYFTPSAFAIVNLDDRSYSLVGELLYTGFGDFEIRARAAFNRGGRLTEYGEKPVDERLELRLRWYF